MDFYKQVVAIVDAFNTDDLDEVMTFFAKDAEYVTFDGRSHKGQQAIRKELEPQFAGKFGELRFVRDKLLVDASQNMAAVSWRCEHGLGGKSFNSPKDLLTKALSIFVGKKPYWEGVDLFHFKDGKVVGKFTYSQSKLPLLRKS